MNRSYDTPPPAWAPQQAEEGLAENLDPMGGSTFSDKAVRLAFIRKVGSSNWTMEKGSVE